MKRKLYKLIRYGWGKTPSGVRSVVKKMGRGVISEVRDKLSDHEILYDEEYYEMQDEHLRNSSPGMAKSIRETFDPRSVLDVGCGTGALLMAFKDDVKTKGLEYSESALKVCEQRDLDVIQFDIRKDPDPFPDRNFDVVASMEVAEHLPDRFSDRYVDFLCGWGDHIIFTAATPGQGGKHHVNEQPHDYWKDKFHNRGFAVSESITNEWKDEWKERGVKEWYWRNLMVFSK